MHSKTFDEATLLCDNCLHHKHLTLIGIRQSDNEKKASLIVSQKVTTLFHIQRAHFSLSLAHGLGYVRGIYRTQQDLVHNSVYESEKIFS